MLKTRHLLIAVVVAVGLIVSAVFIWGEKPLVTENGFFFFDGEYVPPPYQITVERKGIYINGICVEKAPAWKPKPAPETDPGPFEWTPELKRKGWSQAGFLEHMFARHRYWREHYGYADAFSRAQKYLAQQPQVMEVTKEHDHLMSYKLDNGETRTIGFSSAHHRRDPQKHKQDLKRIAASLHKTLSGGRVFFTLNGVEMFMSSGLLREIYEIVVSDETIEDKAVTYSVFNETINTFSIFGSQALIETQALLRRVPNSSIAFFGSLSSPNSSI